VLAEGHSLRCWLLAAQLAVANPPTSLYDGHGTWWLNVLSLPRFLDAIKSALNTRLARARHVLGHTYAAELRLAELRQSVPGAIIQIADAQVESVEEYAVSAADLKASGQPHYASLPSNIFLNSAQRSPTVGLTSACPMARSSSSSWATAPGMSSAHSSRTRSRTRLSCLCLRSCFQR
jgi:hypothetical protein